MSRVLEIEVKGKLKKEEYETLLSNFPNEKQYNQTNFYIDTRDFEIHEKKCGLRVREKNGKYELTLKLKQREGKLEINQDLSKNEFDLLEKCGDFTKGEVSNYITENLEINLKDLFVFTNMKTTRLDINFEDTLISIDKSVCLGETDYEIECEASSIKLAKSSIKKFLKQYGLKYKKFSASKLQRAREYYLK